MGVADNKSYKNQYHFGKGTTFRIDGEDFPSINDEKKINTTIKENPYMSNVEIEGKEVVLQPDLSALFKAVGKRHSKGGMDVLLKPESFIFSDDKTLALDETDYDTFELKKGGSFKPHSNTPAAALKKNIDIKHYNTLINNLDDVNKDDLAKKSSAMMLQKYIETLGNIAYIQENKKGFPQGLPTFSMGTAPVYDGELKSEIEENKQYMKYGGVTMGPGGSTTGDRCPCGKDATGKCIPCTTQQLEEISKKAVKGDLAKAKGMTKIGNLGLTDLYHTGTDPRAGQRQTPGPKMSDSDWRKFIKTPQGQNWLKKYNASQPGTDEFLAITNQPPVTTGEECPCGMGRLGNCLPCDDLTKAPVVEPVPGTVTPDGQNPLDPNWQFTPWQKVSHLYNWLNYANVKRYMPTRSQLDPDYADPALLNEQQAVSDSRGVMNQQVAGLRSTSPILAGAQQNSLFGQYLDKLPEVKVAVQNANAQTKNQFRLDNKQTSNTAKIFNINADQTYYRESVEGRKNFDNLRNFAANNAMSNIMDDVTSNQELAYRMMTVRDPAYILDWRTGKFKPNPNRSIMNQQGTTPADTFERMVEYAKQLKSSGLDPTVQSALLRGQYFKQAAPYFQQSQTPPPYKKGGRVKSRYSK